MSDDLDRRIAEGLEPAASYMPRTAELLPEFRRRLARRRRRTTASAALALAVLLGVGVVAVGRDDQPRRAVTAGSTTSTTAAPTVTSTGLEIGPALAPGDVELPAEGVAVEVADVGVVLVGLDGHVYGHLPGLEIAEDEETAGPILLVARTADLESEDSFFMLTEGRARSVRSTDHHILLPLSYGAELGLSLGDPRGITLSRDGRELFPTVSTMDTTVRVSNDRDVVSRDAWSEGTNQAFDLRTGKVHDVQAGCWVADRHGPRWYLLCRDASQRSFVAAGESPQAASELVGEWQPGSVGDWREAMASPDGSRLLLQWSGSCAGRELLSLPSVGGQPVPLFNTLGGVTADALGWVAEGYPVILVGETPPCADDITPPPAGIYILGRQDALVYRVPHSVAVVRGAMWAPTLR
jgi:hypothetical protein